jgi:hypothetical protein
MSEAKARGEILWTIVRNGPLNVISPTEKEWEQAAAEYDAATAARIAELEATVAAARKLVDSWNALRSMNSGASFDHKEALRSCAKSLEKVVGP